MPLSIGARGRKNETEKIETDETVILPADGYPHATCPVWLGIRTRRRTDIGDANPGGAGRHGDKYHGTAQAGLWEAQRPLVEGRTAGT